MNFSHREIKSLSDSFDLGFGTGIKITITVSSALNLMFYFFALIILKEDVLIIEGNNTK